MASKEPQLSDFLQRKSRTPPPLLPKQVHPKGWEPYVEEKDGKITATTPTFKTATPDEKELISSLDLDTDEWQIDGSIQTSRWQGGKDGEWRYAFKCKLRRRTAEDKLNAELVEAVLKRKPKKFPKESKQNNKAAMVIAVADMQAGKTNDGMGSQQLMERFFFCIDKKVELIKLYSKLGKLPSTGVLASLADLVEGVCGFYATQQFNIDLNSRDQQKLVVALLDYAITSLMPYFDRFIVTGVPGNHGEIRVDGKYVTDRGDNTDLMVLDQLAFAYDKNPEVYQRVEFIIPDQQGAFAIKVADTIIGLTHGHLGGGGANPEAKLLNWWKGQMMGRAENGIGDADILLTGHYHHFRLATVGNRTWIQCPALDGGSQWFKDSTGHDAPAGLLSFVVSGGSWYDLDLTTCNR